MAQVQVLDMYEIMLQKQDEKKFTGRDGNEVRIEAQEARNATVVVCQYDEYTLPFVLPAHFDVKAQKVEKGCFLNIDCPALESVRPLKIKNVNRIIYKKG